MTALRNYSEEKKDCLVERFDLIALIYFDLTTIVFLSQITNIQLTGFE